MKTIGDKFMVKFLKSLFVFLLSLLLIGFINGVMISVTIEQVIQKDLITSLFKQTALPSITGSIGLDEEEQKAFEEMMDDEEVTETINQISGELIEALGDPTVEFDQSSIDDILDYFIENKDKIEELTGSEVDISQLEEFRESEEYKEFGDKLTENIKESTSTMDQTSKDALKAYTYLISNDFRIACVIGAVIVLIIIALVQWSFYKWLGTLGKALTTSGVGIFIFALGANSLIRYFTREYHYHIELNMGNIFFMGAMTAIVGVLFIVICKIIQNMLQIKKNKEVENSEVS